MRAHVEKLDKEFQEVISVAQDIASRERVSVYLVGGCVRDMLLGVNNLDLDIVVVGDGILFAQALASRLKVKLIRHKRFGTATVCISPHHKIDIASTRKERYPHPAHLPEVRKGDLKDDLARRDFTINALAIDITKDRFGELVDFFGGRDDLREGKIRILHPLSFVDDPTRILRAIRFETRYVFSFDAQTRKCLRKALTQGMLLKTEPQRIRAELIMLCKERDPARAIARLAELAGLSFLAPRLRFTHATGKFLCAIRKELRWFNATLHPKRLIEEWLVYCMGLLDPLDLTETKALCKKLIFNKGQEQRLLSYTQHANTCIGQLSKKVLKPSRLHTLLEPLSYEVILAIKAKSRKPIVHRRIADFFNIYHGMRIQLTGHDLQRAGVLPGPVYQKIFRKILCARLDGLIDTREAELAMLQKLLRSVPKVVLRQR